jgi:UMP kinase
MDNKIPLHVFSLKDTDMADVFDKSEVGTIID